MRVARSEAHSCLMHTECDQTSQGSNGNKRTDWVRIHPVYKRHSERYYWYWIQEVEVTDWRRLIPGLNTHMTHTMVLNTVILLLLWAVRPGINSPEWSNHKSTARITGLNAPKIHWGFQQLRSDYSDQNLLKQEEEGATTTQRIDYNLSDFSLVHWPVNYTFVLS